jgi:hypothetical protein
MKSSRNNAVCHVCIVCATYLIAWYVLYCIVILVSVFILILAGISTVIFFIYVMRVLLLLNVQAM